jgi:hypothetical protein
MYLTSGLPKSVYGQFDPDHLGLVLVGLKRLSLWTEVANQFSPYSTDAVQ